MRVNDTRRRVLVSRSVVVVVLSRILGHHIVSYRIVGATVQIFTVLKLGCWKWAGGREVSECFGFQRVTAISM